MKKTKTYKKPGMYLSGLALPVPRRCAAVAELARAPSEFLSSVLAIDVPCLCLEPVQPFEPTTCRRPGRRMAGAASHPRSSHRSAAVGGGGGTIQVGTIC